MNHKFILAFCVLGLLSAIFYYNSPSVAHLEAAGHIAIKVEWNHCDTVSDCLFVANHCNSCCTYSLIGYGYADLYEKISQKTCFQYRGPVCDCLPASYLLKCINKKCVATSCDPAKDEGCKKPYQHNLFYHKKEGI